eukprot:scaffold262314_cov45-Prasinocladus_malaysianus.AAC.2
MKKPPTHRAAASIDKQRDVQQGSPTQSSQSSLPEIDEDHSSDENRDEPDEICVAGADATEPDPGPSLMVGQSAAKKLLAPQPVTAAPITSSSEGISHYNNGASISGDLSAYHSSWSTQQMHEFAQPTPPMVMLPSANAEETAEFQGFSSAAWIHPSRCSAGGVMMRRPMTYTSGGGSLSGSCFDNLTPISSSNSVATDAMSYCFPQTPPSGSGHDAFRICPGKRTSWEALICHGSAWPAAAHNKPASLDRLMPQVPLSLVGWVQDTPQHAMQHMEQPPWLGLPWPMF